MIISLTKTTPGEYLGDVIWTGCPCASQRNGRRSFYESCEHSRQNPQRSVFRHFKAVGPVREKHVLPKDLGRMGMWASSHTPWNREYERDYTCTLCESRLIRSFHTLVLVGESVSFD